MACDRRCFEKDWIYGEISCDDCPGQDSNISMEKRKQLDDALNSIKGEI